MSGNPAMLRRSSPRNESFQDLSPEARKLVKEMGIVDVSPDQVVILHSVLDRALSSNSAQQDKFFFPSPPSVEGCPALPKADLKRGKEIYRGKTCTVFVTGSIATKVIPLSEESATRELMIMRAVGNSPGLSTLLSAYVCLPSELWLQMQVIEGAPLSSVLKHFAFESLQTSFIMRQLAFACLHLHRAKIVHRGISPHNIMISVTGQTTLIDFGSASFCPESGGVSGMIGAPFFVSPEMVRGEVYQYATDIYSLGCVSYVMTTGHLPTLTSSQKSSRVLGLRAMFLVGTNRVPLLDATKYPSSLVEFTTSLMRPDPSSRPDAQSLIDHPFLQQQVLTLDLKKVVTKAAKEKKF